MSKVLVDRELLEKWTDKLEGADSEGYGWEDLLAAEIRGAIAQPVEAEGVEVVGWRIGFPNGSGYKLYEQRQDWAYEGYGSISYEVQDLMTVAQHERIVAALTRPAQTEQQPEQSGLVEVLRDLLDCPYVIEEATVPKAGIAAAPPYQVVGTLHVSLTRLRRARAALAAQEGE